MNLLHLSIVALYLLIMLFKLSHLNLINPQSKTFAIHHDTSENFGAFRTFFKSFSGESFNNFTLFSLITQNGITSLFVVCRNDTVLQIRIEDMKLEGTVFRKYGCSYPYNNECQDEFTINLLSEIELLQEKMVWFCYVLPHDRPTNLTNCVVPQNKIFLDDIKWTKRGYSSTNNRYRTFAIQTWPNIFIGSYNTDSLFILRTKLPDEYGKINTSQDLETPIAEFYFEKNSHFLEAFATKFEVYYVVVEPITAKSHSFKECVTSHDQKTVISTRLLRICKDDPGSHTYYNKENFGTIAKSDLVCPDGVDTDKHYYTRSISSSWSGDKLYVLFANQKNAPPGEALCVYNEISFNSAFNSEMIPPNLFSKDNKVVDDKTIIDPCKKISENSLNDIDKVSIRSMSLNGLYRMKNVFPIALMPLMKLKSSPYHSIDTFKISNREPTNIIMLIANNFIRMLSHDDISLTCYIQDLQLGKDEIIHQVKGNNIKSKVYVHITTNKRVLQLQLSICEAFTDSLTCLEKAPSICGWDSLRKRCTLLLDDVNIETWQRSACKRMDADDTWKLSEKCQVKNGEEQLACTCRYCLKETDCYRGSRVNVTNCYDPRNIDTYGAWSEWSECSSLYQIQRRTRKCQSTKCGVADIEERKCLFKSTMTTNWTKWYKFTDSEQHISFRGKCPMNKFSPPSIEKRTRICRKACQGDSIKWSTWSDCVETSIQYRLFNCSPFEACPHSNIEAKGCIPTIRRYKLDEGSKALKDGNYSMIHIILAILIVSLAWLILLIFVSVCIFRYISNHKRKLKKRPKSSKHYKKGTSFTFKGSSFIPQKSVLSATSNDYLTPDNQSSSYNQTNISISSTLPSDQTSDSSKVISNRFPPIIENYGNIFDR